MNWRFFPIFFSIYLATFMLSGIESIKITTLKGLYNYLNHQCFRNQTEKSVNAIEENISAFILKHKSQIAKKIVLDGKESDLVDILHDLQSKHVYHSAYSGKTYMKYNILKRCARQFIIACTVAQNTSQIFTKLVRYVAVMRLVNINTVTTYINNKRYHVIQDLIYSGRHDLVDVLLENKELLNLKLDVSTSNVPEPIVMAVQMNNNAQLVNSLLRAGVDPTKSTITVNREEYFLDQYVLDPHNQDTDQGIKKLFSLYVPEIKAIQETNKRIQALKGTIITYVYKNRNSPFIVSELEHYLEAFPHEIRAQGRPMFFQPTKSLIDIAMLSKFKVQMIELLLAIAVENDEEALFNELKQSYELVRADSAVKNQGAEAYFSVRDAENRSLAHGAVINQSNSFFQKNIPTIRGNAKDNYGLTPLDYVLMYAQLRKNTVQTKKIMWFLNAWLIKYPLKQKLEEGDVKANHPKELLERYIQLTDTIRIKLGEYIQMTGLQKLFFGTRLEVSWYYFLGQNVKTETLKDYDLKLKYLSLLKSACSRITLLSDFFGDSDVYDSLISKLELQTQQERSTYFKTDYKDELAKKERQVEEQRKIEKDQYIKALERATTTAQFVRLLKQREGKKYLMTLEELITMFSRFVQPKEIDRELFEKLLSALSQSTFKKHFLDEIDLRAMSYDYKYFCRVLTKYSFGFSDKQRTFMLDQLNHYLQCSDIFLNIFTELMQENDQVNAKKLLLSVIQLKLSILPYEQKLRGYEAKADVEELTKIIENIKAARYPIKEYPFLQSVPSLDFSTAMSYKNQSDKKKIHDEMSARYSFRTRDGEFFENVTLLHLAMLDGNAALIENIFSGTSAFYDLLKQTNFLGQTPLNVGLVQALKYQSDTVMFKKLKTSLAILLHLRLRAITKYYNDLYMVHKSFGYPIDIAAQIKDIDILQLVLNSMLDHAGDWMRKPGYGNKATSAAKMHWGGEMNPLHYAAVNNFPDHCEYIIEKTKEANRAELYFDHCVQRWYWYNESTKKYSAQPIKVTMTPRALALVNGKYKALAELVVMDVEDQKILEEGEIYRGTDIEFVSNWGKSLGAMSLARLAKRMLIDGLKEPFLGNYIRWGSWVRTQKYKETKEESYYAHFYSTFLQDDTIKRKEKTFAAFLWRFPIVEPETYRRVMEKALVENNQGIINVILCYAAQYLPYSQAINVFNQYLHTIKMQSLVEAFNFENFLQESAEYENLLEKIEQDNKDALHKQQAVLKRVKFYDLNLLHYAVKGNNFSLVRYLVDVMGFNVDIELVKKPELISKNKPTISTIQIIKPLNFAQTEKMKEFLKIRSKEFSLLARLQKYPKTLNIDYIEAYYKKFPKKLFAGIDNGQTLLDLLVHSEGTEDIIVWLVQQVIDRKNKEYLKYMIPIVEKFLIDKYPKYDIPFTQLPLLVSKTEGESSRMKVLEYAQSKGYEELVMILKEYLKNRKPRVLEPIKQSGDSIVDLGNALVSLQERLVSLFKGLDTFS